MRFLIMGLNYLPESTAIGPYTADLAEYLQGCGHQVQVITGFPMAPQWRVWDTYRGKFFMREIINGVPVLRTFLYVPRNPKKAWKRILFDTSFCLSSLLGGLTTGPFDLTIVISPPLQLGLTAWLLGLCNKSRFFFQIKDLVPDAAIATGMMDQDSLPIRVAYYLERVIYRLACAIGVICEGFTANLIKKGVPPGKISLIPDYIDLDFMRPILRYNSFRQQHGVGRNDFLVMYSGSVALKQGLETFVEAAAEMQSVKEIKFFLTGEGPYLPDLKSKAQYLDLKNFTFLPLQPREGLPQQLAAADALVVTQKRAVTDIVFPGKLLYYMAAGRPILAAVNHNSETGKFIQEYQVGVVVPPEDPQALAGAIRFLQENREKAGQLGENGRRVAEAKFDRRAVLREFARRVETLASK